MSGGAAPRDGASSTAGTSASLRLLGLTPGEWLRFAAVAAQLALLFVVMRRFQIESNAFLRVAGLAFAGFVAHALLPLRFRLPFFALLSLGSLVLVLGPLKAAWLVGVALALIGIAHLPTSLRVRVALLLLAAGLLALMRTGIVPSPWSPAIWPILASLFMFRLIVYLYDLRHEKVPATLPRTIAYFFMLPNVCFPLFPVVDYKTFRRAHYDADAMSIYQTGVRWIARGVVHSLLYRLIYYNYTLDPYDVVDAAGLLQFLTTNFLLYLRLSGQFHMIVGMLHLFGWNLPEANHLYGLAGSVSEFWRRINIYWKDFMMKVFYYPIFFSLRRLGNDVALVLATLSVFAITWALHLYQWFWLRGAALLSATDILFWSILAALVVANSLYEAKRPPRSRRAGPRSPAAALASAARIAGTFTLITVLWALWTSPSLRDWLALLSAGARGSGPIVIGLAFAVAVGLLAVIGLRGASPTAAKPSFIRDAALALAPLVLLLALSHRPLHRFIGPAASQMVESLRVSRMSTRDVALLERGYYEKLLGVSSMNSELWELFMDRPYWPRLAETPACRQTGDVLGLELVPTLVPEWHGAPLRINRLGLRDRDYDREKPPGTYRVACLGASFLMAGGVDESATFENLVEDRLNREAAAGPRIEMLNFGVDGYSAIERLAALQTRVAPFSPDAVFCFPQIVERQVAAHRLEVMIRDRIDVRYDRLREIAAAAGVDARTGPKHARARLAPHAGEILSWAYGEFVRECRAVGAKPVWIFLPRVMRTEDEVEKEDLLRLAREAGFVTLDLTGTFADHDIASLHLAPWDLHPNTKGHALIAERLYAEIRQSGVIPKEN